MNEKTAKQELKNTKKNSTALARKTLSYVSESHSTTTSTTLTHPNIEIFSDYLQSLFNSTPELDLNFLLHTIQNTPIKNNEEFDFVINNLAQKIFNSKISKLSFTEKDLHSFFNFYFNCLLLRYTDKKNIDSGTSNAEESLFHKLTLNAQKKALKTIKNQWLTSLTKRLFETHHQSYNFSQKIKKEIVQNYISFLTTIQNKTSFDLQNWRPETFTIIDLVQSITNRPEALNLLNSLAKEICPHYINIGHIPNGSIENIALWHEKHIFDKHKSPELSRLQEKLKAYPYLYDFLVPVDLKTISYCIKSPELFAFSEQQKIKPLAIDFLDNTFKLAPSLLSSIFITQHQSSNTPSDDTFFLQTIDNLKSTNQEQALPFPTRFAPSMRLISAIGDNGPNILKTLSTAEIPMLYLSTYTNPYTINQIYDHNLFSAVNLIKNHDKLFSNDSLENDPFENNYDKRPAAIFSCTHDNPQHLKQNYCLLNWGLFYSTQLVDEIANPSLSQSATTQTLLPITHPIFEQSNFYQLLKNKKTSDKPILFDAPTQNIIQRIYNYFENIVHLPEKTTKNSFFKIIDSHIDNLNNPQPNNTENNKQKPPKSTHNAVCIEKFFEHLMKTKSDLSFLKSITLNETNNKTNKQLLRKLFSQIEQYNLSISSNAPSTTKIKARTKSL